MLQPARFAAILAPALLAFCAGCRSWAWPCRPASLPNARSICIDLTGRWRSRARPSSSRALVVAQFVDRPAPEHSFGRRLVPVLSPQARAGCRSGI